MLGILSLIAQTAPTAPPATQAPAWSGIATTFIVGVNIVIGIVVTLLIPSIKTLISAAKDLIVEFRSNTAATQAHTAAVWAMQRLGVILLVCSLTMLVAGCTNVPSSTQPTPPSTIERQILLAAYNAVVIAVDTGALPAPDGPIATKAYNDAIAFCDQWDAGTLTEAVAISDIETDLLTLTTKNQSAMKAVAIRHKAMQG